MNDEANSAWKPRKAPRFAIVWLSLLAGTFFVLLAATPFLSGGPARFSEWLPASLGAFVISFAMATALLSVWLVIRWFCCWRNLKRFVIAGACLATLIGAFYLEENWRGRQAWNGFRQEWEAKGEHFTMAGLVPPPVPDDQNFALSPIAFTSYGQVLTRAGKVIPVEKRDGKFDVRMRMRISPQHPVPTNWAGDWVKGTFINLEGWQPRYRDLAANTKEFPVPAQPQSPPADVLLALSRYDPAIEELRVASRLPDSRFPINYDCDPPWAMLLPHLSALKSCAQVLRLRSVAELQSGAPDQAFKDVQLGLQLTDKIRTEPLLISHLVRLAMLQLILQPVWEGLANHQWSDVQLAALDQELLNVDFLAGWRLSMRGELAAVSDSLQLLRRRPEKLRELAELTDFNGNKFGPQLPRWPVARLIPAGWYYQNQLRYARMLEADYIPAADLDRGTFSSKMTRRAEAVLAAESATPFNLCARLARPALGMSARKFAHGQATVVLARTAIALERYRMRHGEFPDALDMLAPQCIAEVPHDVIDGRGLRYHRETGDRFTLYSVGWNGADDGGIVSVKKDGSVDIEGGDWVWRYPSAIPK